MLTAKISGVTPKEGVAYYYQWYNGSKKISGATSSQYKLRYPADSGAKISVQVTARKAGYEDLKLKSETTTPAVSISTKIVATTTTHDAGQASINACKGGLTHMKNVTEVLGQTYLPIESACGGMPILFLEKGHLVQIEGVGLFKVVDKRDVPRGGSTADVRGIQGTHLLQTCYPPNSATPHLMRIVGLQPV